MSATRPVSLCKRAITWSYAAAMRLTDHMQIFRIPFLLLVAHDVIHRDALFNCLQKCRQEVENGTYGEFVTALGKTQHVFENLVNEKYMEVRDKRYQRQATRAINSRYPPGQLVMMKSIPDQTQRAH